MERGPGGATAWSALDWRASATVVGALVLIGSLAVLIVSGFTTSSARIAATTETNGLLSAGTVTLERGLDSSALLFDADGLYPGASVTGCLVIRYEGDVPASLGLFASNDGGSGLDRFIELSLVELTSNTCPDPSAGDVGDEADQSGRELYTGRLDSFWDSHQSFATGLVVSDELTQGDTVAIQATATVIDDNDAAGRDTVFAFLFESRPT